MKKRKLVTERERRKGELHKVFKSYFDTKEIITNSFLMQKINYIPARQIIQAGIISLLAESGCWRGILLNTNTAALHFMK